MKHSQESSLLKWECLSWKDGYLSTQIKGELKVLTACLYSPFSLMCVIQVLIQV